MKRIVLYVLVGMISGVSAVYAESGMRSALPEEHYAFIKKKPQDIYLLGEMQSSQGRERVLNLHRALQEVERRQEIIGKKLKALDMW